MTTPKKPKRKFWQHGIETQFRVRTKLTIFLVNVIGQRYIVSAEIQDLLLVDKDRAELMHRAGEVIFKITILRRILKTAHAHILYGAAGVQRRARIALTFAATWSVFKISLIIAAESAPARQIS
jgi:predicted XRE-type DNA-binding protein